METNTPKSKSFGVILVQTAAINAAAVAGAVGGWCGAMMLKQKLTGREVVKEAESIAQSDAN